MKCESLLFRNLNKLLSVLNQCLGMRNCCIIICFSTADPVCLLIQLQPIKIIVLIPFHFLLSSNSKNIRNFSFKRDFSNAKQIFSKSKALFFILILIIKYWINLKQNQDRLIYNVNDMDLHTESVQKTTFIYQFHIHCLHSCHIPCTPP